MSNITPDKMRGLLVPTVNITKDNIWPAQANFTEMNPRAGVPKPQQQSTGLVVECTGSQDETIVITTQDGGTPGEKATFIFEGEDSIQLGQDHNNSITDWKYLAFTNNPSQSFNDFNAVATSDGTLFCVAEFINGSVYSIAARKQYRDGTVSVVKTFLTETVSGAPNATAHPAICQLKDGSLLVTYFNYTSTDIVNLYVWRSYDNGDNWQQISKRALVDNYIDVGSTGKLIEKTSLVISDDTVSLIVCVQSRSTISGKNSVVQFVSRDSGTTFTSIGNFASDIYHQAVGFALPGGQIGCSYISEVDQIAFTRIPNAGVTIGNDDYQAAKEVIVSNGYSTFAVANGNLIEDGNLTSWFQDGVIYIVAIDTNNKMIGWMSDDLGDTWEYINQSNPLIHKPEIYTPDSAVTYTKLKSVVWEGRAIVMGKTFNSIGMLYLGGWSSVNHPALATQPDRGEYYSWSHSWIHNQTPDTATVWSTTGAGTAAVQSDGLVVNTTNQSRYYDYTGTMNSKRYYRFKMEVSQGNSTIGDYIAFISEQDNGVNGFTLKIRFKTTGFQVLDNTGVLHTETATLNKLTEFLVFTDNETVLIYYRGWDEQQAKKWTEIEVRLATQSTGVVTPKIRFGHITLTASNLISVWSEFHISETLIGVPNSILRGCSYPSYGLYTYVDKGLLLTCKDSPARAEETYKIVARADYPIENIFHQVSLSPRIVWRSEDDTALQFIPIFMDKNVAANGRTLGLSDVIGIHLGNINFRLATLKTWNGSSWDTLAAIDTSEGLQSTFKRSGATIISSSLTKDFYLHYNEANGWRAEIQDGEDKYIIKFNQNSEGVFGGSGTKQATLMIDTDLVDVSTLPTTGTIKMMPTSLTIIKELLQDGPTPGHIALGFEIPAQNTMELYFQIGNQTIGNIYFMAPQYQRGRNITFTPNIQSVTTLDNMFYSRKLSNGSRTFQIGWTEPVDTTRIEDLNPDYWQFSTTTNSQPVANYGDAPFGMLGLCQYLSNQIPVVYLPEIKKSTGSNDTQIFNRYHNHSFVRTTGETTMESVLGEEGVDEMFRVATITLQEIE
jgi:hypothetical protein